MTSTTDPQGANFQVEISINIRQQWYSSQQGMIQLRQEFGIPASDFTDVAAILAQFDALAKKIKEDGK